MMKVKSVLYVFGAEKASGAENVILRLIEANTSNIKAHILLAPGEFAGKLIADKKNVFANIIINDRLKKLNRSEASKFQFIFTALYNYIYNSYIVLKYIKKNKIEFVHANTIVPAFYLVPAIVFSKIFHKKIKWVWSDHDLKYYSKIDHYLSKLCVSLYDVTFVVSNVVREKYGNKNRVKLLYNGIIVKDEFYDKIVKSKERSKLNILHDTIVIGIAASIIHRKGVIALVKVFNNLLYTHSNIRLLVAGNLSKDEIEYGNTFLDIIRDNVNISYLGAVSDMNKFYNVCDIIINNSSANGSEPLGTTIIEAMAHGKIVLASITGGSPEIISDKEDGLLFAPDNFDELYDTISYCIENIERLEYLGINAVQKVLKKFDIIKMVNQYNYNLTELLTTDG